MFWSVVYPFDTAKTMMQTDDLKAPKYRGIIDACRKVTGHALVCKTFHHVVVDTLYSVPTYARWGHMPF